MSYGQKVANHFRHTFKFGSDTWDPTHRFETSWLVSPWVLFGIRATLAVWGFTVMFTCLGFLGTHAAYGGDKAVGETFSYFTYITYWGITFYMLFAAIHTFGYARWGSPPLDRWPRPLQALHSLYYSSIISFPFLVTIIFWGVLYGGDWYPDRYSQWANISIHGLNSLMALSEVVLPRTNPPPFVHVFFLLILLALYCGLAYITHATEGFYVYSFLDPNESGEGATVGYVFGIAIGIIIIFSIVKGLVWVRRWATEDKARRMGKFIDDGSLSSRPDIEMDTQHIMTK